MIFMIHCFWFFLASVFLNLFAKIFDSESFENCSIVHNLTQTVRSSACAAHVHETVRHWFAHIHFVDNESFQIWTDFRAATFTCEYRWRWHDQFLADWFIFEWWKSKKPHANMFILCSFRNDIKCDATEPFTRFTDFFAAAFIVRKTLEQLDETVTIFKCCPGYFNLWTVNSLSLMRNSLGSQR